MRWLRRNRTCLAAGCRRDVPSRISISRVRKICDFGIYISTFVAFAVDPSPSALCAHRAPDPSLLCGVQCFFFLADSFWPLPSSDVRMQLHAVTCFVLLHKFKKLFLKSWMRGLGETQKDTGPVGNGVYI